MEGGREKKEREREKEIHSRIQTFNAISTYIFPRWLTDSMLSHINPYKIISRNGQNCF